MSIKRIVIRFFLSLVIFSCFTGITAQTRITSPYSGFGLGDITFNKYRANSGMGGFSLAYRDPSSVNYTNPASYTAFDSLSFVFQTGILSDFNHLSNSSISQNSNYTSFSYLLFGFPVTKWWRSSLGFLPYSNIGYKIKDLENQTYIHSIDTLNKKINYIFDGEGGIKEVYWGNAFNINKDLSLGFNASYLFGTIDRNQFVTLTDTTYYYFLKQQERIVPNDFYINFGLQYTVHLKKGLSLVTGLTYSAKSSIGSKKQILSTRYIQSGDSPTVIDTISNSGNAKGQIVIPQHLGIGLMLQKENKWLIGADFQMQQWSKYKSFGISDSLVDSWKIAIGGEIIPDLSSVSRYIQKIHYRFGMHYEKTNLKLNGTQINDYGFSIGMVFPFKRTRTNLSVSLDLGQLGTTEKLLIKEQYAKVTFCINIFERWFYKRRYE